jgi:hypothetical protein
MPSFAYVVDPEPHKVAAAQLAIDREIEQGEVAVPDVAEIPGLFRFA